MTDLTNEPVSGLVERVRAGMASRHTTEGVVRAPSNTLVIDASHAALAELQRRLERAEREANEWPAAMHHRIAALTRERDHLRERVESRDCCEAATQARAGSAIMLNESLVEELAQARTRAETAEALVGELREALRQVSNAYGCFAGCTAGLPGARPYAHFFGCAAARAALAKTERDGERGRAS